MSANGASASAAAAASAAANGAPSAVCELVLLGTGVSTALPQISCVLPGASQHCAVCHAGLADPSSRDRRCNVSALVRAGGRNVLIDCGKTVREAALRHLPGLGVPGIDAIVLTHGHADAMLGLDDVRDLVPRVPYGVPQPPTPVFLSAETFEVCRRVFPYLVPPPPGKARGDAGGVERRVASIDWRPFADSALFKPFRPVGGALEFTPVPVLHGGDYVCIGFVIRARGATGPTVAYLSDVKEVPTRTLAFLQALPRVDVLVVDALSPRPHPTHFSLGDALALARLLRPAKTRLVGMGCRVGPHDAANRSLKELVASDGLDVQLAHDGLRLPL